MKLINTKKYKYINIYILICIPLDQRQLGLAKKTQSSYFHYISPTGITVKNIGDKKVSTIKKGKTKCMKKIVFVQLVHFEFNTKLFSHPVWLNFLYSEHV